jgi:FkbM family methyltransferase
MNHIYYALRLFTKIAYRAQGTGIPRIAEVVRRLSAHHAPPHPLQIDDFLGKGKFYCYITEHMGGQIFFRGSYSGSQLELLQRLLPPEGVFIDVGANQGEFTVTAALIAPRGRVLAFEPVAKYRSRLQVNIELNGFSHVTVFPFGLGDEIGTLPIYDSKQAFSDGTRHEGLPTLFKTTQRNSFRETVDIRRLDDIILESDLQRIDVIKLDIEGAEFFALKGAVKSLKRFRPKLILEIGQETCKAAGYAPEELLSWLLERGYHVETVEEAGRTCPLQDSGLRSFQNVVAFPSEACA